MSHRGVQLLRSILRVHRYKLKPQMRELGDKYVLNEFKLHSKIAEKSILKQFYESWESYVTYLKGQEVKFGRNLVSQEEKILTDEQKIKLEEFKSEATALLKNLDDKE